jgi:hypothetical protein
MLQNNTAQHTMRRLLHSPCCVAPGYLTEDMLLCAGLMLLMQYMNGPNRGSLTTCTHWTHSTACLACKLHHHPSASMPLLKAASSQAAS